MKIVDKFLNKHHFFNKPHKWFLAFLSSPIHFAEKHYEKKYKMNFGHARKLFIFDMILLVSIFILTGLTIFWFTYDPTVVENITIKIIPQTHSQAQQTDRVKSGEHIKYLIEYENNSDSILTDPRLTLNLPDHFQVTSATPKNFFTERTKTFSLENLNPGSSGDITIEGFYFGTPGEHERVTAHLSYKQKHRDAREEKLASIITVLQGSYVNADIKTSDKILSNGSTDIEINLSNSGHHDRSDIALPLSNQSFDISDIKVTKGEVDNDIWKVSSLKSGETVSASGTVKLRNYSDQTEIQLQPELTLSGKKVLQEASKHKYQIVQPKVGISSSWESTSALHPGEVRDLNITINNDGNEVVRDMGVVIPIDDKIVNISRLTSLNTGVYKEGSFIISSDYNAALTSLNPGEQKQVSVSIPINQYITTGENLNLSINPSLNAKLSSIAGSEINTKTNSESVKISTSLNLNVSARYYTQEGDQLGRGPLPPRVGQNTKYWVFINFKNTTNDIKDLNFKAALPNYVDWTGKSSVSHGHDIDYDTSSRTAEWTHNELQAHKKGGVYIQLSITPSSDQRGSTPVILRNIEFNAKDKYTDKQITKTINPVDISLPRDSRAQNRGVQVQ